MNINSLSIYSFEYKKIYVGFSGGADSTALLLLLQADSINSSHNNFHFEAVHFEHGLRGEESLRDAQWCKNFCESRNIPFKIISFNNLTDSENLEAEARKERLKYWKSIVKSPDEAVALGHHSDDKIENLILRLARGSNVSGLTALRSSREVEGVTFIRPLLPFRRREIEELLKNEGITDWCEDSTNQELKNKRSAIRNAILPDLYKIFPNSDKAFLKSLDALEKDADYLEKESLKVYKNIISVNNSNNLDVEFNKENAKRDDHIISIDQFATIPSAILVRVLRLWLSTILKFDCIPTSSFMERFEAQLKKSHNSGDLNHSGEEKAIPLCNNVSIVFEKGSVRIAQDVEIENLKKTVWNWRKENKINFGDYRLSAFIVDSLDDSFFREVSHNIICFDAKQFPDKLFIRSREPGDKMVPFGKKSLTSVKKLLEDKKMSTFNKQNIPIVTDINNKIIWIPGVRRANFANVDKDGNIIKGNFLIMKSMKK